jgi:protein-disulfide isomerase
MSQDLQTPVDENDHSRGTPTAPVTLVEYGDYECPDCFNSEPIVQHLLERFANRLRVVFRHFPLSSVHPRASAAAQAAEAAGAQGKFWEMHTALFKNQQRLADLDLTHLALTLGLDVYKFQRDLDSAAFPRKVRSHFDSGVASGVKGTPTFFINGRRYSGQHQADQIAAAIEAASTAG